jgi:hypothetical protein
MWVPGPLAPVERIFLDRYTEMTDRLKLLSEIDFRPASSDDLALLAALGLPESVLEFYRLHEPDGFGRLGLEPLPIKRLLEENRDFRPGYMVSRFGYIVFATSGSGDAFCFDLNGSPEPSNPRIVYVSHDPRYETVEDVSERAPQVATDLADYLTRLANDEIDEDAYRMRPRRH